MKLLTPALFASLALTAAAAPRELVPVDLAYRDASSADEGDRRTVLVQGARQGEGPRLSDACGASAADCECLLFRSGSGEALEGTGLAVSAENNFLTCRIPGDLEAPDEIRSVRVRLRSGEEVTGPVEIRTALRLEDVLGMIPSSAVSGIFRYSCQRTFFEGEGVAPSSVSCVPGQHLGVLRASYNFYVFRSSGDSLAPSGDEPFEEGVCRRNDFLKLRCSGSTPELRYGLLRTALAPYVVAVSMTPGPGRASSLYGFAALPDSAGRCPLGLAKARPWLAHPASITEGSLDGTNPPSSFLNENDSLDDEIIEVGRPASFQVWRQPSQVACSAADGDCTSAAFGAEQVARTTPYSTLSPIVCVVPPEYLGGLF